MTSLNPSIDPDTAFSEAIKAQDLPAMILLLDQHPDLHLFPNDHGQRPLHQAVIASFTGGVKLLLERGANGDAKTLRDGLNALHLAASRHHVDIVTALLEAKVQVNLPCDFGNTPAHLAAAKGDHDVLTRLLEHGANANATNADGNTVLHFAVDHGSIFCVQELIEKGASIKTANLFGATPVTFAKLKSDHAMLSYLQEADLALQEKALLNESLASSISSNPSAVSSTQNPEAHTPLKRL